MVWGIRHLPIVAECRAKVFKFLHILKRSATVAKHWWVGAKEGHGFGIVHIQRQLFQSRVGMKSVKLEQEVVGSVGSECNVICVFTMGNFLLFARLSLPIFTSAGFKKASVTTTKRCDIHCACCKISSDWKGEESLAEPFEDMYVCNVCNRTYRWPCLLTLGCYKDKDRESVKKDETWACLACACLTNSEKESQLYLAEIFQMPLKWPLTSAPVLLFKMRCIFFHFKTCLCALSGNRTFSSLSSPFYHKWFTMPCLVRLSLIFFLNSTTNSVILSRTFWTIFLAGEDQQQTNQPNALNTITPLPKKPKVPTTPHLHQVSQPRQPSRDVRRAHASSMSIWGRYTSSRLNTAKIHGLDTN